MSTPKVKKSTADQELISAVLESVLSLAKNIHVDASMNKQLLDMGVSTPTHQLIADILEKNEIQFQAGLHDQISAGAYKMLFDLFLAYFQKHKRHVKKLWVNADPQIMQIYIQPDSLSSKVTSLLNKPLTEYVLTSEYQRFPVKFWFVSEELASTLKFRTVELK